MPRAASTAVPSSASPASPSFTLSPGVRAVASVLLALHLAAVVSAPLAGPNPSRLASAMFLLFRPYLEAAYLNHAYLFFVPEPGPGHLVRYELEMPDGTRREGQFPNRAEHRPRLLYHRHFMLSEKIGGPPDDRIAAWTRSYAEHLLARHGARRVTLYLRVHLLPDDELVRRGRSLDHPDSYLPDRLLLRWPKEAP